MIRIGIRSFGGFREFFQNLLVGIFICVDIRKCDWRDASCIAHSLDAFQREHMRFEFKVCHGYHLLSASIIALRRRKEERREEMEWIKALWNFPSGKEQKMMKEANFLVRISVVVTIVNVIILVYKSLQ